MARVSTPTDPLQATHTRSRSTQDSHQQADVLTQAADNKHFESYSPFHSRGSSVDDAASTEMSEFEEEAKGFSRCLRPLAAASRLQLRGGQMTRKGRRRLMKDVKNAVSRQEIRTAIAEENIRFEQAAIKPSYASVPEELSPRFEKFESIPHKKYEEAKNGLKKEFRIRFTGKSHGVGTFLDSATEVINDYKLSPEQAQKLILSFFADVLKTTVSSSLRRRGVRATIEYLREFKTTCATTDQFQQEIAEWKLNRSESIKDQIMHLLDLFLLAYPDSTLESAERLAQARVHMILSQEEMKALQIEVQRQKALRAGQGLQFKEFANYLAQNLAPKAPRKDKKEVKLTSELDINEISRLTDAIQQVNTFFSRPEARQILTAYHVEQEERQKEKHILSRETCHDMPAEFSESANSDQEDTF